MTAEEIAQRCDQADHTATGWQACCPAHEDTTPSLSITQTTDKVLLHCHAGCTYKAILAALRLQPADLFLRDTTPGSHKRIVKVYDYIDVYGHVVHQTIRYDPKGFKQRRPDPANANTYIWSLKGIQPVLYHLPELLGARQRGEIVYIVEGEKDADALQALGCVSTCNAMGAEKWRTSYSDTLQGASCIILPDNDDAGWKHAELVAHSLHGKAAEIKILTLPDLPDKGDVSDWLQAGGTRRELEMLATAAPLWTPAAAQTPAARFQGSSHEREAGDPGDLQDARPLIRIGPDITRMVDAGQAALLALPHGPVLFQRARRLAIIARGVKPPRWLHRPSDAPVIIEVHARHLEELAPRPPGGRNMTRGGNAGRKCQPPPGGWRHSTAVPPGPFPSWKASSTAPHSAQMAVYSTPQGMTSRPGSSSTATARYFQPSPSGRPWMTPGQRLAACKRL